MSTEKSRPLIAEAFSALNRASFKMAMTVNMIAIYVVAVAAFFTCLIRCPVESIRMHLPKPKEYKETPLLSGKVLSFRREAPQHNVTSMITGAEKIGTGDLIGPEDIVR